MNRGKFEKQPHSRISFAKLNHDGHEQCATFEQAEYDAQKNCAFNALKTVQWC